MRSSEIYVAITTGCRREQAHAYLEYLAVRGRGKLVTFEEHVVTERDKKQHGFSGDLSTQAVVGAIDFRRQTIKAPSGKGMGTSQRAA